MTEADGRSAGIAELEAELAALQAEPEQGGHALDEAAERVTERHASSRRPRPGSSCTLRPTRCASTGADDRTATLRCLDADAWVTS